MFTFLTFSQYRKFLRKYFPWKNILTYLTLLEGITSTARRKLEKESKPVDGFIQDALKRNCSDALQ